MPRGNYPCYLRDLIRHRERLYCNLDSANDTTQKSVTKTKRNVGYYDIYAHLAFLIQMLYTFWKYLPSM